LQTDPIPFIFGTISVKDLPQILHLSVPRRPRYVLNPVSAELRSVPKSETRRPRYVLNTLLYASADLQSVPTSKSRQYEFKKLQQILLDRFTCQLARVD
jgi:hypothetical protein